MRYLLASTLGALTICWLAGSAAGADPPPSQPSPTATLSTGPITIQPMPTVLPPPDNDHASPSCHGAGGCGGCRPFVAYGFEVCRGLILYARHDDLAPLMWQGDPHNCGLVSPFYCGPWGGCRGTVLSPAPPPRFAPHPVAAAPAPDEPELLPPPREASE